MIATILGLFHALTFLKWLPLVAAPAATIAAHFLPKWWKVAAIGLGLVLFVGFIGIQRIEIANRDATIAKDELRLTTLIGWLKTAQDGERTAVATNQQNVAQFDTLKAGWQANIAALAQQRDSLAAALNAAREQNMRSTINADLKVCPGPLPLPLRDVLGELRQGT